MTQKMGNTYDPKLILLGNKFDPRHYNKKYIFCFLHIIHYINSH